MVQIIPPSSSHLLPMPLSYAHTSSRALDPPPRQAPRRRYVRRGVQRGQARGEAVGQLALERLVGGVCSAPSARDLHDQRLSKGALSRSAPRTKGMELFCVAAARGLPNRARGISARADAFVQSQRVRCVPPFRRFTGSLLDGNVLSIVISSQWRPQHTADSRSLARAANNGKGARFSGFYR